jgi:hypothetical protein
MQNYSNFVDGAFKRKCIEILLHGEIMKKIFESVFFFLTVLGF